MEEAEGGEVGLLVSAGGDGTAAAIADCLIRMGSRLPLDLDEALEVQRWTGSRPGGRR